MPVVQAAGPLICETTSCMRKPVAYWVIARLWARVLGGWASLCWCCAEGCVLNSITSTTAAVLWTQAQCRQTAGGGVSADQAPRTTAASCSRHLLIRQGESNVLQQLRTPFAGQHICGEHMRAQGKMPNYISSHPCASVPGMCGTSPASVRSRGWLCGPCCMACSCRLAVCRSGSPHRP